VASPDCSLAKIQSEVGLQGAGRFIHHVLWQHPLWATLLSAIDNIVNNCYNRPNQSTIPPH
jgi:hypothetical protein